MPGQRTPVLDDGGQLSRPWFLLLQQLVQNSYSLATTLPSDITVGDSPFTYTNTTQALVTVLISGGGVTKLEFSRDGVTLYDCGSYYGMFSLSPSDRLVITYVSAPTITLIPR